MHRDEFDQNKFILFRNFYDINHVKRMARRMMFLKQTNKLESDKQCPMSSGIYSDSVNSEFQELYRNKLETLIGYSLYPTYTYARIYSPKEILEKHTDRPSCEISITATLEYDTFDDEPWGFYVEPDIKIRLYPGDALVYKGCEIEHWREKFIGVYQTQVFMHYVDSNGLYADCKYDFRPNLASSLKNKNYELERIFLERLNENNSEQKPIRASGVARFPRRRRTKTNLERD
jgi:hypothetical protein